MPYVALRPALGGNPVGGGASAAFLQAQLGTTAVIAFAPLGWWMALRAGWAAVALGIWSLPIARRWLAAAAVGITLLVMLKLASDLSRSAAILTPVMLWGCFVLARRFPAQAPRVLLAAGLINLLLPAAHVVYTKIDLISPLPIELFRLLRGG